MKKTVGFFLLISAISISAKANHIDFVSDGGLFLSTTSVLGALDAAQLGAAGNIVGEEREVSIDFSSGSGILSTGIIDVPLGPGPVGPNENIVLLFDNSVNSVGTLKLD